MRVSLPFSLCLQRSVFVIEVSTTNGSVAVTLVVGLTGGSHGLSESVCTLHHSSNVETTVKTRRSLLQSSQSGRVLALNSLWGADAQVLCCADLSQDLLNQHKIKPLSQTLSSLATGCSSHTCAEVQLVSTALLSLEFGKQSLQWKRGAFALSLQPENPVFFI